MGLFDDVGPVQEELTIENMPLVDLFNKAVKDVEELEANCNMEAYEQMRASLAMIVKRMGEVPPAAKAKIAGLPAVITGTLPYIKTLIGYGPSAADGISKLTNSIKTVLYFGIGNL